MSRTRITGLSVKDDSLSGSNVREESLLVEKMPFSAPYFSSQNVRDAIIEAKSSSSTNFSYNRVVSGLILEVPENQQMIVFGELTIEGELVIGGEVCFL